MVGEIEGWTETDGSAETCRWPEPSWLDEGVEETIVKLLA